MEITFTDPLYLFLLSAIPLLVITHYFSLKYTKMRAIKFSNFEALRRATSGDKLSRGIVSKNLGVLIIRSLTLTLLILAAAGPVVWFTSMKSDHNYVIALDASGSMLAEDFSPNRLEAAKESAIIFTQNVIGQTSVGVVSFAGISYIDSRLTDDLVQIKESIEGISIKSSHGTAIGDALKTSANILLAKDRAGVIILLTDGRENIASDEEFGKVIEYLNENHIVVNTIGIGTKAGGRIPGLEIMSSIDENKLSEIALRTGGSYFKADDKLALNNAYESIISSSTAIVPFNLRFFLILLTIVILFNEWGLISTKFRNLP